MGYYYSSYCTTQTCPSYCCNYNGGCPNYSSSSSNQNMCWYYYSYYSKGTGCTNYGTTSCCYSTGTGHYDCSTATSNASVGGTIAGAVVGGVIGLIILIILIVCCCKKYRQPTMVPGQNGGTTTFVVNQPGFQQGYPTQGYQPNYQPNYQPDIYGAPVYGAPVYGQPAYGQPQQQGPIIITQ